MASADGLEVADTVIVERRHWTRPIILGSHRMEEIRMIGLKRVTAWLALGTIMAAVVATTGFAQDVNGNWTEYNGDYRAWRYSPLDKINKSNVGKLKVAWIHQPGDITSGIQVTPLVIDGVMYYIAANNRVTQSKRQPALSFGTSSPNSMQITSNRSSHP